MSYTRRVQGTYNIETINEHGAINGSVTIATDTMRINGNLVVTGTTAAVESTDLEITDQTIILNKGEAGAGVTGLYSGVEIERGTEANVGLRYNESAGAWQGTNDGTTWEYLLSSSNGSSGLTAVFDDKTPELGGNLDVLTHGIVSSSNRDITIAPNGSGQIVLNTEFKVINTPSAPDATPGYNTVYAKTPGSGGSGLYVKNSTVNDELVSKTKAMVFSIIF